MEAGNGKEVEAGGSHLMQREAGKSMASETGQGVPEHGSPPHRHFTFLVLPLQNLFGHKISWRHASLHSPYLTIFSEFFAYIWIANPKFNMERGVDGI